MPNPAALPANLDDALNAYKAGEPVEECAAIADISKRTLVKYARRAGLPKRRAVADSDALDAAINAYIGGLTVAQCAERCGIGRETFRQHLIRRGVALRDRTVANGRRKQTPDGLVEDYLGGLSVQAVADKYALERSSVYRMLREVGIDGRNRSEAMQLRWQHASATERSAMIERAHKALRGRSVPDVTRGNIARANAGKPRSASETALGALLVDLGYDIAYGVPCGRYNLDLVISGTVAVEVFGGHWHETGRHRARFAERSRYVFDAGYSLAIVWTDKARYPVGVPCAKHLATLAQITCGHPSIRRQHWVIRGDGHFLAVREDDGDEVPFITSAGRSDR